MDNTPIPLVDKDYLLIKTGGDCAWTFAQITDLPMPKTRFGMLRVRGRIDDYEFANVNLMPIGNGHVGLAVKAEIRKRIKKQAGDTVRIVLYEDNRPTTIPEELVECFDTEEGVLDNFQTYSESEKRAIIDWIYSAKKEETRVNRITQAIENILKGEKFYKAW